MAFDHGTTGRSLNSSISGLSASGGDTAVTAATTTCTADFSAVLAR